MGKSHVNLGINNIILERAKLKNINLSKEFELLLERILDMPFEKELTDKDKINAELKEKQILLNDTLREINALKNLSKYADEKATKDRIEEIKAQTGLSDKDIKEMIEKGQMRL